MSGSATWPADLFNLDGAVAVVTGACGKLGPVWMAALAGAGARVVGLDLSDSPGDRLIPLFDRFGTGRVALRVGDVTSLNSLEQALEWCAGTFGCPSILVNNAGIDQPPSSGPTYSIEAMPVDAWRSVLEVNVLGAFQASQVFVRPMLESGRGAIVNIGSLYASVSPDQRFYDHLPQNPPFRKLPAYGASKAALVNLTKYLATLWAPKSVRVNSLSPGGVQGGQDSEFQRKYTSRVPLGRMAEAADLAGPLLFLASDAARYVTGIDLRVDGGFTAW